ncbi:MAG: formyl transferase [Armatimonadetes bacterium]|nr:formyl transferase [Armatimonadota bacterium]
MKTVLLTTDTTHHLYYAWKLHERFPLDAIFLETSGLRFPFDTGHPFEAERDAYERDELLQGAPAALTDIAPVESYSSMNNPECVAALEQRAPDVVLVFGTGLLKPPIIRVARTACLNLHGGNPEEYRGLDTHLWAIYHRDFANLVTTLHHVAVELDTGDLVLQEELRLRPGMPLSQLRAVNTGACVRLSLLALLSLAELGTVPSRSQVKLGRYYSAMPSVLKEVCVQRFARYTSTL